MRVLLMSELYPPYIGGTELHVRNLARGLARRGHEVTVATATAERDAAVSDEDGVAVHRLPSTTMRLGAAPTGRPHMPPAPDPQLTLGLRSLVREARPDVVHAHNWIDHSFVPLKRSTGAPLVVTLHDYSLVCARRDLLHRGVECSGPGFEKCLRCAGRAYGELRGPVIALANWGFGAALRASVDMWIPVSRAVAEGNRLERHGLPYEVVTNFIPDDVLAEATPLDPALAALPAGPFWLYVGALSRHKGLHHLIEAYRGISGAPPLVIIGRRHADAPPSFPENVLVLHDLSHGAVMAAWQRATVGIVPSVFPDPCPTVALEAMAAGVPIVGSRNGGLADLVADEETGLLVEPGDVAGLREALCRLHEDPEARQRMADAARERAPRFMARNVIGRIEAVYERAGQ